MVKRGTFYTGTSNIVLPITRKDFPEGYKDASRLALLQLTVQQPGSKQFVLQGSKRDTFAKWANDVPDDFRFTVKLWREITHQRKPTPQPRQHQSVYAGRRWNRREERMPASPVPRQYYRKSITSRCTRSYRSSSNTITHRPGKFVWSSGIRAGTLPTQQSRCWMICQASLTGHDSQNQKLPWTKPAGHEPPFSRRGRRPSAIAYTPDA